LMNCIMTSRGMNDSITFQTLASEEGESGENILKCIQLSESL